MEVKTMTQFFSTQLSFTLNEKHLRNISFAFLMKQKLTDYKKLNDSSENFSI